VYRGPLRGRRRRAISCKYLSYSYEQEGEIVRIKLPLLRVRLVHHGRSILTIALIDSGSTATFLQREIASLLNLESVGTTEVVAAGGRIMADIAALEALELMKGGQVFGEFREVFVLVPQQDGLPYSILGRDTIFQVFDIQFRERSARFILRKPRIR